MAMQLATADHIRTHVCTSTRKQNGVDDPRLEARRYGTYSYGVM